MRGFSIAFLTARLRSFLFLKRLWVLIRIGFKSPCSALARKAWVQILASLLLSGVMVLAVNPTVAGFLKAVIDGDSQILMDQLPLAAVAMGSMTLFGVSSCWNDRL